MNQVSHAWKHSSYQKYLQGTTVCLGSFLNSKHLAHEHGTLFILEYPAWCVGLVLADPSQRPSSESRHRTPAELVSFIVELEHGADNKTVLRNYNKVQ